MGLCFTSQFAITINRTLTKAAITSITIFVSYCIPQKRAIKEEGRRAMANQIKGWLLEKSASTTLRLSSKRWCVLDGHQLLIYDTCEEVKPIKALYLPQFQVKMIIGDMDSEDEDAGGQRSDESDPTIQESEEQYILELRPKRGNSKSQDVYMFAVQTGHDFNEWGRLLSMSANVIKKHSAPELSFLDVSSSSNSSDLSGSYLSSPDDDVFHRNRSHTQPMLPQHKLVPNFTVTTGSDSPSGGSPSMKRHIISRTSSMPFSPYTKEKAEFDFNQILQRADFTFWEEKEPSDKSSPRTPSKSPGSSSHQPIETCLLAPSTKKSPGSTPTHSPTIPRRADQRWSSLPANVRSQVSPVNQRRSKSPGTATKSPKTSPSGSPSLRKRVSRRLGASWERSSWGGGNISPKMSPILSRKSCGFANHLSPDDFNDSYGLFETRSSQRLKDQDGEKIGNGNVDGMSQVGKLLKVFFRCSINKNVQFFGAP